MTQHHDLAIETELRHRRSSLQQDAERHHLIQLVSRARAAATRVRNPRPGRTAE